MPELPEVETIVKGLNKAIKYRRLKSVEIKVSKLFFGDSRKIINVNVKDIIRAGKNILIRFDNNLTLAIHLKMTGQLIFIENCLPAKASLALRAGKLKIENSTESSVVGGHPDKAYNQPSPHKHTHIIIRFRDGSTLYYNDLRKFGWMKIIETADEEKITSKLGPDALGEIDPKYLSMIFHKRKNSPVKNILLDQSVIAGIGNIYADESLFMAGILPSKNAGLIKPAQIVRLINSIKFVLKKAINLGGTSKSDYRKVDGTKGNYLDYAFVYGKENMPCRNCKTPIRKIKIGQRSSRYCHICQN